MFGLYRRARRWLRPYRPDSYWRNAGRVPRTDILRRQADNILRHLAELEFDSVYEVGIGEGRIAGLILESRDIDRYDSCDMTPVRRDAALDSLGGYPQFDVALTSFQEAAPAGTYDMVLAVECLMHVKLDELESVMRKMAGHAGRYCVNVDYWDPVPLDPVPLDPHNFAHDYEAVYGSLGMSCRRIVLPYRQALFVASV